MTDWITKIVEQDKRLRAAEEANPVSRLTSIEQANARLAAENAAERERLGIGTGRAKTEKAQAAAYRRDQAAAVLYQEAVAAYEDDSAWRDVQTGPDEWDVENRNTRFEDAVAKLMALGPAGESFLAGLATEVGEFALMEVAELVERRDTLRAKVERHKAQQEALVARRADAEKLEARIEELVKLNPQFQPYDPALVADIAHYREQAKRSDLPEEKKAFIEQIKALEVEQGRRALAADNAARLFVSYLEETPDADFAEAENAFIGALQVSDAEYMAAKDAERVTARYQRDADARNIGPDSRQEDGKLVIVSPNGDTILAVTDDAAATSLASGWVPIRAWEAVGNPDYLSAVNPQPSEAEVAEQFAEAWNAVDHEALAEQALIEHGRAQRESKERAEAAKAEREAHDHAETVRRANQLAP